MKLKAFNLILTMMMKKYIKYKLIKTKTPRADSPSIHLFRSAMKEYDI